MVAIVDLRKAPRPEAKGLKLDLQGLAWHGGKGIGPAGLDARSRDLLEIARLVWEVERNTPKRVSSQRVREVHVVMPVRDPKAWTDDLLHTLSAILRLLGNAEWKFDFVGRSGTTRLDSFADGLGKSPSEASEHVALFSGGLDSTCGLGWLMVNGIEPVLASFYGAKAKQQKIARDFGFRRHVQVSCTWESGRRHFGGQFQYRSFLFLILGAVVARSFRAGTLYQFENGPLAIALPPSATYRMTRHAHPMLHSLAGELFRGLFGSRLEVVNPFLVVTKFESTAWLRRQVGDDRFDAASRETESCWNLNSRQVVGKIGKDIGQPCGLCIPCLVRRTALRGKDVSHAVELTNRTGPHFADANARIHVDAYLAWASKMLEGRYDLDRFAFELPQVARDAIAHSGGILTPEGTLQLYRRFAAEIVDTFPQA